MGWSVDGVMCGDKFLGYIFKSFGGSFDADHCGKLQALSVAVKINVPGSPYISPKAAGEILELADDDGFVSSGADKGSGQCVALVKTAVAALGPTRVDGAPNWCKGDDLDSSNISNYQPGTVIGYGFNSQGKYASLKTGNHVAILVSAKDGRVRILDQWRHSDEKCQKAAIHQIDIDAKDWAIVTRCNED